jgi:hypothetical protein
MLKDGEAAATLLRVFGSTLCFAMIAVAGAVTQTAPWATPRTAWGDPDFQGQTWDFSTMTPLERPAGIDKPEFSEAEAAAFEPSTLERQKASNTNGPDWWDEGSRHLDRRRTALIVDPADGHLPALTPEAARRAAAARQLAQRPAEGPQDFPLNTRCINFQSTGPPMIPAPYNDNLLFFQTREHIAILNENIHDVRIVPLDGRPHGSVRQWMGDGRGRWDGDTLVIDTTQFSSQATVRGANVNLHVVERFTRTAVNTLEYRFTVEDPTVWIAPWTALLTMRGSRHGTYEFACHEGNTRSMEGLLRGARTLDKIEGNGPR